MELDACLPALIGVMGTICGTVLGWILNSLSKVGRLKIIHFVFDDEFKKVESAFEGMSPCTCQQDAGFYSCSLIVDIYNSAGEPLVMSGMQLEFNDGKKRVFSHPLRHLGDEKPYDKDDACEVARPLTIPAKTVERLRLYAEMTKHTPMFCNIWKTKHIYFIYRDCHNKEKRKRIRDLPYDQYFQIDKDYIL